MRVTVETALFERAKIVRVILDPSDITKLVTGQYLTQSLTNPASGPIDAIRLMVGYDSREETDSALD